LLLSPLTTHTKVIMAPFNSERAGERRGVSFALGGGRGNRRRSARNQRDYLAACAARAEASV
jgi:hypothetical protein